MSDPKEIPSYLSGAIAQIVRSAVNLWLWANILECKKLPQGKWTCFVYPSQMELKGPKDMNEKRVRVVFEIEDDDSI